MLVRKPHYRYVGGRLTISGDISVALTGPGRAESAFVADQSALTICDAEGNPVPGLTFEAQRLSSSGTLTTWDSATSSWRMSVLTLG